MAWSCSDTALYFSAVLNDTIPDHEGCDSVRWLELTINHSVFDTLDTLVCDIFQWRVNSEVYTADKVQTEYFNTIHGCDSIHHLILEMHYRFDTTEYREACNTFYWPVDRRTYTRSATHAERMLTQYACDSIHELILTVYHTYRDTMYDTICHYDSRAFGGHSYNMSGHYYDTVPMMRECDTIHELFLHVKQELPLEIDWTSQCEQLQYTIFAFNPRGDSLRGQINWQAFPVDHELDWQAYNDTVYVHPTLNTVYSATLYYNDGSPYLCPETRTVQLTPTQEVKAEINASTVCFTPDILDLRATADGSGFSVIEWFVDGSYYSGLKTIHYRYDPETATADSVRVTLRVSNGYCHDADTFMIHYLVGALHVPNIFSPSEERISRFKVTGTGITEYTIRIYNRQGLIVFESESLEDAWDGKLKDGTKAEQGAYVYLINYRTVLAPEELKVKTGTVVLLR